ncbi:MAG: hypothetical protein PF487_09020 [Bacteroidales bacterium]|jgi:hypothetical protein|nr:hypothetical protein [Bacteroidales bacterium]
MKRNITENNKAIAIFMGCELGYEDKFILTDRVFKAIEYHCSDDWLMPVVRVIISPDIYECVKLSKQPVVGDALISILRTNLMQADQDLTYKNVVSFCVWYNEQCR